MTIPDGTFCKQVRITKQENKKQVHQQNLFVWLKARLAVGQSNFSPQKATVKVDLPRIR